MVAAWLAGIHQGVSAAELEAGMITRMFVAARFPKLAREHCSGDNPFVHEDILTNSAPTRGTRGA